MQRRKLCTTTQVTASGGREGHGRSDDGVLDMPMSIPAKMGGPGREASNPEQLFAAGYSACFENAVLHVTKQEGVEIEASSVTARVDLGVNDDGSFGLKVDMKVSLQGVKRERAGPLIQEAGRLCPYSNAVRGSVPDNIELA